MADITSRATVELVINGKSADDTLQNLKNKAADLKKKMDECVLKNDLKGAQRYQRQLERTEKEISKITALGNNFSKTLNNLDRASLKNLQDTLKQLQRQIKGIDRGTEEWNRHAEAIRRVRSQINQANSALSAVNSTTKSLASRALDFFNKWQVAILGVVAALAGIIQTARKAVSSYADMDEAMANTRKFTSMTTEQVEELNEAFRKMDTRTAREKLNDLAQEAGRLGKSTKEDVLGYVKAADVINVALSDLGDGATQSIAKLSNIFKIEDKYGTYDAMLKIGSVVNVLSQNCTASKPYLVEFANRLAGVGNQANISLQNIIGFGAVLDANAQMVEASATAIGQVLTRMYREPAKYAKVAGLDVKLFSDTLKKDANEALLMFLDTLGKAGDLNVLSPMFKDMGENGARVITALSTLSKHIDEVRWQQKNANEAFEEGTSVLHEYQIFNNTAQSGIDKAKKRIAELSIELGEKLMPVMKHVYSSSSVMLRVLSASINFISNHKIAIISAVGAYAIYKAAIMAVAAETKILTALESGLNLIRNTGRVITIGCSYAYNSLTGNVEKAAIAQRKFNAVFNKSAWGLVITLVATVIGMITDYISKTNTARETARKHAEELRKYSAEATDYSKRAVQQYSEEISKLKMLYEAATDETRAKEARIEAAKKLIATYPETFSKFSTEQIMLGKSKKAYDSLTRSIIANAKAKAAAELVRENEKEILALTVERSEFSNERKEASAERDKIRERNKATNDRASKVASTLTGSIAMSNSPETYRLESTAVQDARVREATANMNERTEKINAKKRANLTLLNEFKGNKTFENEISSSIGITDSDSNDESRGSYTSSKLAEKEAKKAAAAARSAAVKARKEFKEELNSAKGVWEAGDAENIAQYSQGLKSWSEFLEQKHILQVKFFDDQMKIYQKHNLQEDEDYQELLKKKEQLNSDWLSRKAAMSVEDAKNNQKAEEMQAQFDFDSPESPMFRNEEALQLRLHDIKVKYLEKMRDAYSKDTKEYHDFSLQLTETEEQEKLRIRKKFADAYVKYSREYQLKSAKEQYDIQIALLNDMLEKEVISLQEYKAAVDKLKKEVAENSIPESARNRVPEEESDAKSKIRDLQDLQAAFSAGLITETEYLKSRDNIEEYYQKKAIDRARRTGNEYSSMLLNLYEAFKAFSEDGNGNIWQKIGTAAEASFAVMGAAMSAFSEFAKAESDALIASVEKRYNAEAALAEGNVYKQKQAEKKKQKEIAKIKGDANRKQFTMQILQAIAQTATNALNAYGAMVGIPVVGPTLAAIAAAMAAAAGAVQIATIRKQKQASEAAGYMQGGFTPKGRKDEPVGVVHAGEWVAPQEIVNSPQTRPIINMLEHARRNNRVASIRQADVSMAAAPMLARQRHHDQVTVRNMPAPEIDNSELKETISRLNDRLDEPFVTVNSVSGHYGIKRAWDEYDRLIRNKSRNKRRS